MTIYDPYDRTPQTVPGLNTGSATQVSTMTPVETGPARTNRYRSGLLSALAPFLGSLTVLLVVLMGLAEAAARALCLEGRLTATACTAEPAQLVLFPLGVLLIGLLLAAIGGSLAKRRRAAGSLVALAAGFVLLVAATQWFSTSLLGLPFP